MEDLIESQKQIAIQKVVKILNSARLANKNKWVADSIPLIVAPNMVATLKYKMYNTWVQLFILDVKLRNDEGQHTIKDSSPMDMKVGKFKEWIALATSKYLNTLRYFMLWNDYGQDTNRLSTDS